MFLISLVCAQQDGGNEAAAVVAVVAAVAEQVVAVAAALAENRSMLVRLGQQIRPEMQEPAKEGAQVRKCSGFQRVSVFTGVRTAGR
jgi:hypothetical protein